MTGTSLGQYNIGEPLGEGGMGAVYRATDTVLKRQVAIKVLPAAVAGDPDRLARFQREAEVLAALNHPNIAHVYGFEQQRDAANATVRQYLVLELVEGDTLADRLASGPIPLEEALPLAGQIAEAMEVAHEQGIVHRDLKPANIKVRSDGTVKVLDFGLAKAMEPAAASGPQASMATVTTPAMTQAGVILGTAAYMSPEQAKGKPVDRRADVWAFGAVLYETLTGARAFPGEDITDTIVSVVSKEPDWARLPADTPLRLRDLLRRCMEKDPRRRLRDIGEARVLLEDLRSGRVAAVAAPPVVAVLPRTPLWRRLVPVVATAAVVGVGTTLLWSSRVPPSPAAGITRFSITLGDNLNFLRTSSRLLAISPDGQRIVYVGNRQLYLRSMSDMEARPIPGTADVDPADPYFSPDGQWIAFYSVRDGSVRKIAVSGGASVTLAQLGGATVGGHQGGIWQGNDLYFARQHMGIVRVPANGGEPEIVVPTEGAQLAYGPQLLPGGRALLFSLSSGLGTDFWDTAQIVVQSLPSGERKVVLQGGGAARYLPSGHLVYALGSTVLAVPFDPGRFEVRGAPVTILEGVRRSQDQISGAAQFVVADNGTMAYVPGDARTVTPRTLAFVDGSGRVQPLGLPAMPYSHPRVSPDGRQLAVATDDGTEANIWVADLRSGAAPRRLTFGGKNHSPIWTPDSQFITFASDREGALNVYRQRADGAGTAERVSGPDALIRPETWHRDGKTLVVIANREAGDIVAVRQGEKPEPIIATHDNERFSAFSPDGRWLAYSSSETGRFEVFVQPFPTTGAKYQVSNGGGRDAVWGPDGKRLFFNTRLGNADEEPGRLMAVDVRTEPAFSFTAPVAVPSGDAPLGGNGRNYDVTPDGNGLLVVLPANATGGARPAVQQFNVVLNWFEELKSRVPLPSR